MSLEDIQKIPDQNMKNIHLSLHKERERSSAMEKMLLAEAGKIRQKRLDAVKKKVSAGQYKIVADLLPSATLSLGPDGSVKDSLETAIRILEEAPRLPDMLASNAPLALQEHPKDMEEGGMSEERRSAIVDEMAANYGLPKRQPATAGK
jgi:hypothetical protein